MTSSEAAYEAVVLAGGGARRLDGADKPGLLVGGRALVEWVAAAVAGAERLTLVGPPRPELPHATVVREDPPGGGPVPALRAGLPGVRAPQVAVLAADLPFLRPPHVEALRRSAYGRSGAVLVDADGRPQWLAGVWRTADLRAALASYGGSSLRGLMDPLDPARVRAAGEWPAWYDCDTPSDVAAASRMIRENSA
ncbi:molybdenum cofactor guanylyltransferase [Actinomadura sp. DC4]|uniref:molybdenum cofactor guanylyltransferase n=1 Tax=Actinomadura sp. DC4 TaxID=3055069 RepID=UPI0025B188C7|nr:molybdenum cofactor guanylyltransferase [Actinomadura sp. DC4]MDN3355291.1 molybdenum cofactor guanylyltransferase [Actinomadura sp. DC4]